VLHNVGNETTTTTRGAVHYLEYIEIFSGLLIIYGSVSKPCTPVVHIKIAGKWMFITLKMVLIGIDPYPYQTTRNNAIKNWWFARITMGCYHKELIKPWDT